jgi:hypothetical protein
MRPPPGRFPEPRSVQRVDVEHSERHFLQQNFSPFASGGPMKNFSDAAFSPDVIEIMTAALEESINTLPHPVSTTHVDLLAESILRTANAGERDVAVLKRIALVELQITPRS